MVEHPLIRHAYAAFTNQGFLLREVSLTAELLRNNATKVDVRREVVENDLYQLASKASRKTSVNAPNRLAHGLFLVLRSHVTFSSN